MIYRVRFPIALGQQIIPPGTLLREGRLKANAVVALVRRGGIAPVAAPPLVALPGWERRAELVGQIGIIDAVQFLEADVDEVARHVGVSPGLVRRWQGHVESWLTVPAQKRAG